MSRNGRWRRYFRGGSRQVGKKGSSAAACPATLLSALEKRRFWVHGHPSDSGRHRLWTRPVRLNPGSSIILCGGIQLNVPFIADGQYITFLNGLGERLHGVHYSLCDPVLNDARIRLQTTEIEGVIGWLQALPGPRKYLLANEGCLDQCPYRSTHEALIAATNTGLAFDTFRLNRDLGCMRLLSRSPHRILASPFIRPEDLQRFEGVADIIKVCGRTLGRAFLERAVGAYAEGTFHGNLLELLDAAHWMAGQWDLANHRLPDSFFDRVTTCDRFCHDCTGCRDLWRQSARAVPFGIKDLRRDAPNRSGLCEEVRFSPESLNREIECKTKTK